MWHDGKFKVLNNGSMHNVKYWAKVYDEPSSYGIDDGRISKLQIEVDERLTVDYDRDWYTKPEDEVSIQAYMKLVKEFN